MLKRNKHPNKEIEAVIQYAELHGWQYKKPGGSAHAWGRILCPLTSREGCALSVWSTLRNPYQHAAQIRKRVDACPHTKKEVANETSHPSFHFSVS